MNHRPHRVKKPQARFGLVLLLLSLAASAQGKNSVQAHLGAARTSFEELDYGQALKELDRAQRLARTDEETVSILLYRGLVLALWNREEEAMVAFQVALRLRPEANLPLRTSPKIEQRFNALRQKAQRNAAQTAVKPQEEQHSEDPQPQAAIQPPSPSPDTSIAEEVPPATPLPTPAAPEAQPGQSPQAQGPLAQVPPPGPAAPSTTGVSANPLVPSLAESSEGAPSRARVLFPAISGGVLLAAGGVFYGLARKEHSRLQNRDASLATLGDARRSASQGRTFQTLGFGLMGAGLVGLGVATGLYASSEPTGQISIDAGTSGTSAFIHGSWP